jgi:RecA/RadA recombinase
MAYKKKTKDTEVISADSFIRNLIADDNIASVADDGVGAAEFTGTIDTGSYALNALFSGSIHGGVADNKVTGFAGESSTGKTFFILSVLKPYLDANPTAIVVYYDTEAAVTKKMMKDRGIDVSRVIIAEPETLEAFRTHAVKFIDKYMQSPAPRPPMVFVLDSLGMLPSEKEVNDMMAGENKRDMTKQQLIRGMFRVLTLRLAKAKIGMLLTQHTYEVVGAYVPTKAIAGGGGAIYAASTIATLTKSKERDGDKNVIGNVITVTMFKSRLSKENQKVKVLVTYDKGLDRYYGLLDIAEKYGIVKKVSKKYEFPNGETAFESEIEKNGAHYFDPLLDQIDEVCKQEFMYGSGNAVDDEDLEETVELE